MKNEVTIVMTVEELINALKQYPKDMRVANAGLPYEGLEVRLFRNESDNPRVKEFDFVAID